VSRAIPIRTGLREASFNAGISYRGPSGWDLIPLQRACRNVFARQSGCNMAIPADFGENRRLKPDQGIVSVRFSRKRSPQVHTCQSGSVLLSL
jgi:hypothetical protein